MNFEEKIIERLKRIEREVERLRVKERPAGGSGVTDHGALTGLSDDDHPQYLLTTGKAADSDKLDGIDSTGFVQTSGNQTVGGIKTFTSIPALPATNPTTANQAMRKGFADATYLGISAKAADSDKLDGLDSTDFALASEIGAWQDWTPTIGYVGGSGTPTITAGGRYMIVGKIVFLLLTGHLTRNGATHAYFSIPTPTSIAKFGSGSFTHQFLTSFSNGAVYKTGSSATFTVSTGNWTNDGYYWFSGFYEMP